MGFRLSWRSATLLVAFVCLQVMVWNAGPMIVNQLRDHSSVLQEGHEIGISETDNGMIAGGSSTDHGEARGTDTLWGDDRTGRQRRRPAAPSLSLWRRLTNTLFASNAKAAGRSASQPLPSLPCNFAVSKQGEPVYEKESEINYANHPLSAMRPSNQYTSATPSAPWPKQGTEEELPIVTVITATYNPQARLLDTYTLLASQSLQRFEWIVVNDHSTQLQYLDQLRSRVAGDRRVRIVDNDGQRGLPSARNFGFKHVRSKYLSFLDDDDLFELTAIEKSVWFLESNAGMAMCGFYTVGFGAKNYTWVHGFHDGPANIYDNKLIVSTFIRVSALRTSTLGGPYDIYDASMVGGMEDWDLWLRLASRGHWGFTMSENLFWYHVRSDEARKKLWPSLFEKNVEVKQSMRQKYASLVEHGMPDVSIAEMRQFERVPGEASFTNPLQPRCKRIMIILPWLGNSGWDVFHINLVRALALDGWLVTVVCTMYNPPTSTASRPLVMQYTHDVFTLPSFLRAVDFPRFIVYLAKSRNIDKILLSSTQLAYELLPFLAKSLPNTAFVDFVHSEQDWKNGGFLRYSAINARYLTKTFVSSSLLRDRLHQEGRELGSVAVAYVGADIRATMRRDGDKYSTRSKLNLPFEAVIILVLGNLGAEQQPWLVTDVVAETLKAVRPRPIYVVVLGESPQLISMEARAKQSGLSSVFLFGGAATNAETLEYMRAADIFFMPSVAEGVSVRLYQAMAMSLAVVASNVGGQDEVLQPGCGYLVHVTSRYDESIALYASKLTLLAINQQLRITVSNNARKRIETMFDADRLMAGVVAQLAAASRSALPLEDTQHPAIYYALDNALRETKDFSDIKMVELKRRLPPRQGFGAKVQGFCGEYSTDVTRWIDGLLTGLCDENLQNEDLRHLHDAAMYQCGQWCLFRLRQQDGGANANANANAHNVKQRLPHHEGWVFNGACFNRFGVEHYCHQQFAHLRPKM
eukprot:m.46221 g.46221  ORF g.46221 m.46221 type:complete len:978 (+) comp11842_c1_seq1:126-3059(+)